MIEAHKLAGFLAAHAIWCVSDGETLIPMFGFINSNGERVLNRLMHDKLEDAVEIGKDRLKKNGDDASDAVLIFDGRITLDDGKYDALIVEMRAYFSPWSKVVLAIPYSPGNDGRKFRVHRPKYLQWERCDDFDMSTCFEEFFAGVDTHEKGSKIWADCIDQSI